MSAGTLIVLLALIISVHDILKYILKLIEYRIKNPTTRAIKHKDLYKLLDDVDERF